MSLRQLSMLGEADLGLLMLLSAFLVVFCFAVVIRLTKQPGNGLTGALFMMVAMFALIAAIMCGSMLVAMYIQSGVKHG